jgi:hypothetical protein
MPLDKEEFEKGKLQSKVGDEIISFLRERKDGAFTSQEVMGGLDHNPDFSTSEVAKLSTFVIADFTALLHDLVRRGRVEMKVVRGRMYFMVKGDAAARCSKCGIEIVTPRKTWKMVGRPDKKGKRLELHIGLYDCPRHGTFRSVLNKRRI